LNAIGVLSARIKRLFHCKFLWFKKDHRKMWIYCTKDLKVKRLYCSCEKTFWQRED